MIADRSAPRRLATTIALGVAAWLAVAGTGCQRVEESAPAPSARPTPVEQPPFVGASTCASCHPTQAQAV